MDVRPHVFGCIAQEQDLEREMRMVREAILLVSSGISSRVIIAGIQFGDDEAGLVVLDARRAGVRVRTVPAAGSAGSDIVIEGALVG